MQGFHDSINNLNQIKQKIVSNRDTFSLISLGILFIYLENYAVFIATKLTENVNLLTLKKYVIKKRTLSKHIFNRIFASGNEFIWFTQI